MPRSPVDFSPNFSIIACRTRVLEFLYARERRPASQVA
jgi:hypothetical protein